MAPNAGSASAPSDTCVASSPARRGRSRRPRRRSGRPRRRARGPCRRAYGRRPAAPWCADIRQAAVSARMGAMGTAADRWRDELMAWAVPPEIEAAATRSPWGHPADRFAMRADTAVAEPEARPSTVRWRRCLAGLGARRRRRRGSRWPAAAAVRLVPHRRRPVGADAHDARRARRGCSVRRRGPSSGAGPTRPDVVGVHDVVVCHHVFYDVGDLAPSWWPSRRRARRRGGRELPPVHPQTWMAPLWLHFHGCRPSGRPDRGRRRGRRTGDRRRDVVVDRWQRADPGHPATSPHHPTALPSRVPARHEVAAAPERRYPPAPPRRSWTLELVGSAAVGV